MKKFLQTAILSGIMMASATALAAIPDAEVGLGGIAPGISVEEASSKLGAPTRAGKRLTFPNGLVGKVDEDAPTIIEELETKTEQGPATPSGIAVGMAESALLDVYGEADKVDRDSDDTEYEYLSQNGLMKLEFKVVGGTIVKIQCELR